MCHHPGLVNLSIDPGISTGWAFWGVDRCLKSCGAGEPPPACCLVTHLIIECPKIYPARLMKGDPNNIVTLAVRVGRYIERYGANGFTSVFPSEWKGQLDKDVHHPRIFRRLSEKEKDIVRAAGKGKGMGKKALGDMMDAVGLGQYAWDMGYFR